MNTAREKLRNIETARKQDMTPGEIGRLARAFEHTAIGMALQDPRGYWLEVNPAFCHILGMSREELVGKHFSSVTHPDDQDRSFRQLERLNSGELTSFRFDKRYIHNDGREVWVRLDVSMVRDDQDRPDFIITQVQDITVSRQIRQALADSEARLTSIITAMADGVVVINADGRISLANERAARVLGRQREELTEASAQESSWNCIHTDGTPFPVEDHPAAMTLRTGRPQREVVMGVIRPDGSLVWIEISSEPVREGPGGEIVAVVVTFSDITERRKTEQALKDSEERLSLALEGAKLGLWDWRLNSGEFGFSRAAAHMLGYRTGDVAPNVEAVRELFHPEDQAGLIARLDAHLCGQSPFYEVDARMRRKQGGYQWVLIRGRITQRDGDGRPVRVSGTFMDITQWKQLEGRLVKMATTDALTGLYNRRHATEILAGEVERSGRAQSPFSLILLDLDHFKQVNDALGHDAGDEALVQVAELIRGRVRKGDVAARWGGEEFAIILPETRLEGAAHLAQELLAAMAQQTDPVEHGLSASFGVVEHQRGETVSELLKRADRLMYQAKDAGRARVEAA